MAKTELDLFKQINNALLDLQASQHQTFERPLKTLARLLHHPDLAVVNEALTEGVNLDAFLAASDDGGGGGFGGERLAWPDDRDEVLGLTLLLIDKLAADPSYAISFSHHYFYSDTKIISGIHSLNRQVLMPFARDYKTYVTNFGDPEPRLVALGATKVFLVHGHDEAALNIVARFLEKLELEVIILKELPDQGRTIIEKFEDSSSEVGFAVVLITPDDVGGAAAVGNQGARARQNVVFELGYFAGKLGRERVCLLRKGEVEIPSDLFGVIYTDMDPSGGWKQRLVGELKAAKLEFDANKMWA